MKFLTKLAVKIKVTVNDTTKIIKQYYQGRTKLLFALIKLSKWLGD